MHLLRLIALLLLLNTTAALVDKKYDVLFLLFEKLKISSKHHAKIHKAVTMASNIYSLATYFA